MDITGLDITILVASTTGIILMSLVFPALGMAGDTANESEVPEFDMSSDRFDFAGDLPERPSEQSDQMYDGTLNISTDSPGDSEFISGSTSDGIEVVAINENGSNQYAEIEVALQKWYEGDVNTSDEIAYQSAILTSEGQDVTLQIGPHTGYWYTNATFTLSDVSNEGTENFTASVGYTNDLDEDDQLIDWTGLPIIGGFIEGGLEVAAGVFWIAEILFWLVELGFEMLLNAVAVTLDIVTFMFGLADFLVGTYVDVTTSDDIAPWASVILVIPGVLLMVEWAKLAAVLVSVVWIG